MTPQALWGVAQAGATLEMGTVPAAGAAQAVPQPWGGEQAQMGAWEGLGNAAWGSRDAANTVL